jgi:hypothetical protein
MGETRSMYQVRIARGQGSRKDGIGLLRRQMRGMSLGVWEGDRGREDLAGGLVELNG